MNSSQLLMFYTAAGTYKKHSTGQEKQAVNCSTTISPIVTVIDSTLEGDLRQLVTISPLAGVEQAGQPRITKIVDCVGGVLVFFVLVITLWRMLVLKYKNTTR